MKDDLCKAFCDQLSVHSVPDGLAIGTEFNGIAGDPIGFYIVGPDDNGLFRIEDDGQTVSFLEMSGADLGNAARLEVFDGLLANHAASYDSDEGDLFIAGLQKRDVPSAAIRFVALLLRTQDILFMAAERAASTFREDAMRLLRRKVGDTAVIKESEVIHPRLKDFPADVLIKAKNKVPVALMLGTSDQKVTEALLLHAVARLEVPELRVRVVALIEQERAVTEKSRRRAANRLSAVTYFRGDEDAAIDRVVQEVQTVH